MNLNLKYYLNNKPLYYKEIDYNRVHNAYAILKLHIVKVMTIHIVGTNGKGSTGRALSHLAYKSGLSVGHFSSPHILKFNERIWINGEDSLDENLDKAHKKLFSILGQEISDGLSYFEYSTLLALVVFERCDLIVLEAGLGGEFDATNICDKILSIITPIGIDHQDFLGDTIEKIATTKINSIQKQMLLAPQIYDEVEEIAQKICEEKNSMFFKAKIESNDFLENIAKEKKYAHYLIENIQVAIQSLDISNIKYNLKDLYSLEFFGRFYTLQENIIIDVGHNPLGAMAIEKSLKDKIVLIYNSLDDKDYKKVLKILKPKVKRVEIIKIDSKRATLNKNIENALENLGLEYCYFDGNIEKNENYFVFGSFYVIESFLNKINVKN